MFLPIKGHFQSIVLFAIFILVDPEYIGPNFVIGHSEESLSMSQLLKVVTKIHTNTTSCEVYSHHNYLAKQNLWYRHYYTNSIVYTVFSFDCIDIRPLYSLQLELVY